MQASWWWHWWHARPRFCKRAPLLHAAACPQAAELLAEAKQKYEAGDRMTAMRMYESVLGQVRTQAADARSPAAAGAGAPMCAALVPLQASLTTSQRLAAMYGTLAVHASFGDVELAQMALRGAGGCAWPPVRAHAQAAAASGSPPGCARLRKQR